MPLGQHDELVASLYFIELSQISLRLANLWHQSCCKGHK